MMIFVSHLAIVKQKGRLPLLGTHVNDQKGISRSLEKLEHPWDIPVQDRENNQESQNLTFVGTQHQMKIKS